MALLGPPLSDRQIRQLAGISVLTYDQLQQKRVLPKKGQGWILLYRTSDNFGHYCLFMQRPDGVYEFFDPLGKLLDRELYFNNKGMNQHLGQGKPWLSDLIRHTINNFHGEYNELPLQNEKDPRDQSCGYWAILRYHFRHLSLDTFQKNVLRLAKELKITPSQLACAAVTEATS